MNKFTKEDYENAAKVSLSYAGMCRCLGISPRGGNYATIKNNISAVGRYYGVTDNAVRKWCSLYKI